MTVPLTAYEQQMYDALATFVDGRHPGATISKAGFRRRASTSDALTNRIFNAAEANGLIKKTVQGYGKPMDG